MFCAYPKCINLALGIFHSVEGESYWLCSDHATNKHAEDLYIQTKYLKQNKGDSNNTIMSKVVKGHPPLVELLAKKLFGIEGVPKETIPRMIHRAIYAAQDWHDQEIKKVVDFCACGPWHNSKDEPPPKDGTNIIADWNNTDIKALAVVHWGTDMDFDGWLDFWSNPVTDQSPDRWAEIRS